MQSQKGPEKKFERKDDKPQSVPSGDKIFEKELAELAAGPKRIQEAQKSLERVGEIRMQDITREEAASSFRLTRIYLKRIGLTIEDLKKMIDFQPPTQKEVERVFGHADTEFSPDDFARDMETATARKLIAVIKNLQREIGTDMDGIFGQKSMLALLKDPHYLARTNAFAVLRSKNIEEKTLANRIQNQLRAEKIAKERMRPLSHKELMATLTESELNILQQIIPKMIDATDQWIGYFKDGEQKLAHIINDPNSRFIEIATEYSIMPAKYTRDVIAEFRSKEGGGDMLASK